MNHLEQTARPNNVLIPSIEEKPNEIDVVQKICDYIGLDIESGKIERVHRVQSKNPNNKVKSIVLQFSDRKNKENFLAAAKLKRMKRENGTPKMQITGLSNEFFINEHLTLANKILYKATRSAAKTKNHKYTWVKNGWIFVRKDDSSRVIHISATGALGKL